MKLAAEQVVEVLRAAGETVWRIGSVDTRATNEAQTIVT